MVKVWNKNKKVFLGRFYIPAWMVQTNKYKLYTLKYVFILSNISNLSLVVIITKSIVRQKGF